MQRPDGATTGGLGAAATGRAGTRLLSSVPAEVLEKTRSKEAELSAERAKLSQELNCLAVE
jgi:hypothetical protein